MPAATSTLRAVIGAVATAFRAITTGSTYTNTLGSDAVKLGCPADATALGTPPRVFLWYDDAITSTWEHALGSYNRRASIVGFAIVAGTSTEDDELQLAALDLLNDLERAHDVDRTWGGLVLPTSMSGTAVAGSIIGGPSVGVVSFRIDVDLVSHLGQGL